MRELALHLLDIAENGVNAGATRIVIEVAEDLRTDRLQLAVEDNGRGMDEDLLKRVIDPFTTSRTTRKVGLGIPMLKLAAEMCGGGVEIKSMPGVGTRLTADFQRSHIDRMPLGDVAGTMLTLMVGWPQINWVLKYRINDSEFEFDDAPIKQELGDVPLSEPTILTYLRESLRDGIREAQHTAEQAQYVW